MTNDELSQLVYLKTEKKIVAGELSRIRQRAAAATLPVIRDGLRDIEGILSARLAAITQEMNELESFIHGIEDCYIQRLFIERYARGKSWVFIAIELGYPSEDSLKKACQRFLSKINKE